jgi:hypothetical protein
MGHKSLLVIRYSIDLIYRSPPTRSVRRALGFVLTAQGRSTNTGYYHFPGDSGPYVPPGTNSGYGCLLSTDFPPVLYLPAGDRVTGCADYG